MQNRMEVQFLNLKQGDMTVPQYASKFNELARFAPHQVDTEERKTRRFEEGLKPWIYNKVAVLQLEDYSQILEKAIIVEGWQNTTKRKMPKKGIMGVSIKEEMVGEITKENSILEKIFKRKGKIKRK